MDSPIYAFTKGVYNLIKDTIIPEDSAQDELNWITQDAKLKLVYGKKPIGAEGGVGSIGGLHVAYKTDGTKILFRKILTKVQYFDGTDWQDVITGLTSGADYCFGNYSSLAGRFVVISGVDGLYKINTANPASYVSLYDATKNDKGYFLINKGRLIMWNCANASKTTLKLSYIDGQDGTVYTTVSSEATTSLSGTLAFKSGHATRNCFGVQITITGSGEVFTDNGNGTLTGSAGGTGTINYITGAYTLSHSGVGTATYLWEDSNAKGITDFTFSSTRVASEGNRITQDIGGDQILSVLIGQDGKYYSEKSQSAYVLDISADDKTFTNTVYRTDIGIPSWRAGASTSKGIIFMNTANPDKPELTILQRNPVGDNIEPVVLFPHFKFSNYDYSDCSISTWERYLIISCMKKGSTVNDTILLCDLAQGSVDIAGYNARMFAKDSGNLYAGSPISETVFQLFNGFDDNGYSILNYWIGKGEQYMSLKSRSTRWRFIAERLKKIRRLRFEGAIDPNQEVQVYLSFDDAGFQLVGTITGKGAYVDYTTTQTVGSNMIGDVQVGGADTTNAYPFQCEFKIKCPKFKKRTLKLVATSIGYFELNKMTDWNILLFENRLPSRFRSRQHVSLDGTETNQDYFTN